jgi:2-dehydropantoate 2-reductase
MEEDRARRGELLTVRPIAGTNRGGGSTWQSLARGTGTTEVDYLNGEIAWIGRNHGIAVPVNARLSEVARQAAREKWAPRSRAAAELLIGL